MKLGSVGLVPYEPPGSPALFRAFEQRLERSDGWSLRRHGAVVSGRDVMDAFFCLEELEESAHVAWELCKSVTYFAARDNSGTKTAFRGERSFLYGQRAFWERNRQICGADRRILGREWT